MRSEQEIKEEIKATGIQEDFYEVKAYKSLDAGDQLSALEKQMQCLARRIALQWVLGADK